MAAGRADARSSLISDTQIEGRHPVREALRAGRPLRKLLVARTAARTAGLRHLIGEARRRGIPVQEVDAAVLERLARTRTPQGIIAVAAAHATVELDDVLARSRGRAEAPLLLMLDGIEDPGNLGAILRSADAAGVHGVVIPRRRAAGLSAAVAATSAGAIEHVLVAQVANLTAAIERLKAEGIWVIGADPGASDDLYNVSLLPPVALVVGSEGRGLSRLVRERCDRLVRIPMYGATASLNASVAAALCLFEVRRQMRAATGSP
ncbi:MAG: 23S rRNA (guanosine(2251)-2'-O)-methyltransferase RlmB [Armatimonadota bacterium]|nr:23S rRNA (guanosine(2251)-2'-O)-methyltransferase RlmB [Armatimonadota bacterium]